MTTHCTICNIERTYAVENGIKFSPKYNRCTKCRSALLLKWRHDNKERDVKYKREYNKQYRTKNREILAKNSSEYRSKHKERLRASERERGRRKYAEIRNSLELFIQRLYVTVRNRSYIRGRKSVDCVVTADELLNIYHLQNGRCALTNVEMVWQFKSPLQISVDRIDSSGIYELSNVQLVCKWVNFAKNDLTNEQFDGLLRQLVISYKEKLDVRNG